MEEQVLTSPLALRVWELFLKLWIAPPSAHSVVNTKNILATNHVEDTITPVFSFCHITPGGALTNRRPLEVKVMTLCDLLIPARGGWRHEGRSVNNKLLIADWVTIRRWRRVVFRSHSLSFTHLFLICFVHVGRSLATNIVGAFPRGFILVFDDSVHFQ